MSVEAVDKSLDRGLVQVTQVRSTLSRFLAEHQRLRVDKPKSVNDDFTLHGLYGIDDDGDSSRCQLLEALLSVDID